MVCIASKQLRIEIDELGAQMRSLYSIPQQMEYLWQRDAAIWSSSAPVVFPVIGKLHNLSYQLDGKTYSMRSNGILRYETLPILAQGGSYVEFLFTSTQETMKQYPYQCRVRLRYEVIDNKLIVTAAISNDDTRTLYYNYAGHPGFRIPLDENESCDDYYVEFEKPETMNIYEVCESGQLLQKQQPFFHEERRFFIRKNLFQKEALAFIHPASTKLHIRSLTKQTKITVDFTGFDHVGIWSPYHKEKKLSFLCVEPWIGHTDFYGYEGDFSKRDGIASLAPKKTSVHQYSITIS